MNRKKHFVENRYFPFSVYFQHSGILYHLDYMYINRETGRGVIFHVNDTKMKITVTSGFIRCIDPNYMNISFNSKDLFKEITIGFDADLRATSESFPSLSDGTLRSVHLWFNGEYCWYHPQSHPTRRWSRGLQSVELGRGFTIWFWLKLFSYVKT